ncbi:unnamed protein product [Mytilus coruscus]|uniref:Uncharacterized protein n=1 Tax=Mytilus coruscus TaxID=42192 RepID=A0A6J8C3D9_MYTCO|nr:unnamed protein product [Mytilus coruscus]
MGRHNKANVQAYRQRRKIKKRQKKKLLKKQTSDKAVITLKRSCDIEDLDKTNYNVSESMSGIHVNTEEEQLKSIESQSTKSSGNLDSDTESKTSDISCRSPFNMICYHQAEVLKKVISFCSDKGLGECEIDQLKLLMTEQSQIESACLQLNSEYKLNKYVRENFGFVPPVQYDLNRNSKHGKYQYIPIFQTLEKLLSHDDVFSYLINDHQSGENYLRDFCDGDLFRNHALFSSGHTALQIIFYFDEFTASNPIGHKVKNFKIGAFYMTLGNIPPKYRSQLYTIQLVALCMSSLLKTHGFKEVLQPLFYDLKLLETEEITIIKSDGDHKFYGSLSVVLADNLGAHGIGGFLKSISCLRSCRRRKQ